MNRRTFPRHAALTTAGLMGGRAAAPRAASDRIMTVTRPIAASDFGRALVHEHVVVDFIGADWVHPQRYDPDPAWKTALPQFQRLRSEGVKSLVECTLSSPGCSRTSGLRASLTPNWSNCWSPTRRPR